MLTRVLIAINVIVYLWEQATGAMSSDQAMLAHGALLGTDVLEGQWWRIVTSAFLHENILHISFNMFALWQVGTFVEMIYGAPRMLAIYALSGLGSGLLVTYWTPNDITLGASGAIFGLFGALMVAGQQLGERGRAIVRQCIGIIVLNLVIGFTIPNISNAGHIGGLLAGIVAGFVLFRRPRALVRAKAEPVYAQRIDPRQDPGAVTIEHPPVEHQPPG